MGCARYETQFNTSQHELTTAMQYSREAARHVVAAEALRTRLRLFW